MEYKDQVIGLYESLLAAPAHHAEIEYLQHRLSITREEVVDAWLFYDTGIMNYSNESYSSISLRLAMHLHNSLSANWHDRRQSIVSEYLKELDPVSVCEIGFGTPQRYVRHLLSASHSRITLCDYEYSSMKFAATVLDFWSHDWADSVRLLEHDMDHDSLPPGHSVYIFQDSIEHALQPTTTLHSYVKEVSAGTHFIFSLPVEVENPIPGHNISWTDESMVIDWLSGVGLAVVDSEVIHFQRDIDLHAHFLHPDTRQLAVLAVKK
ncbi:hypothetical protein IU427_25100 [Nocardia beijingensis]|uniref:hypothetical protein n=1 Tax=Nocardia beijingensis TaxID=95162 RepID=UPI001892F596|nr:hypothetical protein [Nocardia beijingensis]MBF6468421.1 hypothetical protein [Nocardia beijingensis]